MRNLCISDGGLYWEDDYGKEYAAEWEELTRAYEKEDKYRCDVMKINAEKMLLWLKDKKENTENFVEGCAETQNYFAAIEARSEAFMLEYIIDYIEKGEDYRNEVDGNQFGWVEEG